MERVYQHFIVEGNPKGVDEQRQCVYTGTGCAVGCMMTPKDASEVCGTVGGTFFRRYRDIYDIYFTLECLCLLTDLQMAHDRSNEETIVADLTECLKQHGFTLPEAVA